MANQQPLQMMFGVPIIIYDWPDSDELNRSLEELVLAEEATDDNGRGIRSNAGGWQSRGNLITREAPAIQQYKDRVQSMIFSLLGELVLKDGTERQFTLMIDAWANVCRRGNYNVMHSHPNSMWSVVYYVATGEPDPEPPQNGKLELLNPLEALNQIQVERTVLDARTFIEPVAGRMVVFPSWIRHMVHPFDGEGVRISLAANVNVVENAPADPRSQGG